MEKKIDKTFSRAMNEINSLQKAFKAGGKFEKAVSDIGGDIAWFNEVNEAFDNLYDALEEAHMGATGHLGMDEVAESQLTEGVLDSDDDDGFMARSQLYFLARDAIQLHGIIDDREELEPWVQSKISQASQGIDAVRRYSEYNALKQEMPQDDDQELMASNTPNMDSEIAAYHKQLNLPAGGFGGKLAAEGEEIAFEADESDEEEAINEYQSGAPASSIRPRARPSMTKSLRPMARPNALKRIGGMPGGSTRGIDPKDNYSPEDLKRLLNQSEGAVDEGSYGKKKKKKYYEDVDTDAVDQLVLYAENDGMLYDTSTVPVQKNLTRKWKKGTYQHELAIKLWKYHADRAAKKYAEEFGGPVMSPDVRRAAAKEFADSWHEELKAGNMHEGKYKNDAQRKAIHAAKNEAYSPGDENEEGMVSNCCGAPIMDVYQGHGRCSDCKEMASAEKVEESVNEGMEFDEKRTDDLEVVAKDIFKNALANAKKKVK